MQSVMAIHRVFFYPRESLWRLCVGVLRVCRQPSPVLHTYTQLPPFSKQAKLRELHNSVIQMFKPTPNPPEDPATSPYESLDSKKLHEAADRALDHYLCPPGSTPPPRKTRRMYAVTADFKNEELLADASETLASARTIAHDFAHLVPASQRRTLLGIAQLIMLGELAVSRVMDNLELPG